MMERECPFPSPLLLIFAMPPTGRKCPCRRQATRAHQGGVGPLGELGVRQGPVRQAEKPDCASSPSLPVPRLDQAVPLGRMPLGSVTQNPSWGMSEQPVSPRRQTLTGRQTRRWPVGCRRTWLLVTNVEKCSALRSKCIFLRFSLWFDPGVFCYLFAPPCLACRFHCHSPLDPIRLLELRTTPLRSRQEGGDWECDSCP